MHLCYGELIKIAAVFFECIIAPGYSDDALAVLQQKKNIRLLQWPENWQVSSRDKWDIKKISGGLLLQEVDRSTESYSQWQLKSGKGVTAVNELEFTWKMVKHVKSNAIVLVKNGQLIGVGAGQMSRVDSVQIAISKAKEFGFDLMGAVLASDAFFPFADSIETSGAEGISTIIEPGGSVRDEEVIEAANRLNLTLYFTGVRHFKH